MKAPGFMCDHTGKSSQARTAALASTLGGVAYALAPAFMEPDMRYVVDHFVLAGLLGGPGGLALWQKIQAESSKEPSA